MRVYQVKNELYCMYIALMVKGLNFLLQMMQKIQINFNIMYGTNHPQAK